MRVPADPLVIVGVQGAAVTRSVPHPLATGVAVSVCFIPRAIIVFHAGVIHTHTKSTDSKEYL